MKKIFLLLLISTLSILASAQVYNGSKITKTPEEKLNDQYCSGLFKSYTGTIFDLEDNNQTALSYLNILDWLQGRVAGLQIFTTTTGSTDSFYPRNLCWSFFR